MVSFRFVAICNDIFQVVKLGVPSAAPPSHPFIQSAIIYYMACMKESTFPMPRDQRHAIYALMERQMSVVLRVDACTDVLLGLIILAHSPALQIPNNDIYRDPFRANTLAFNMAVDLELEESVKKISRHRASDITWSTHELLLRNMGLVSSLDHAMPRSLGNSRSHAPDISGIQRLSGTARKSRNRNRLRRHLDSRAISRSKTFGVSNLGGQRQSLPFHILVPLSINFVQESDLLTHLWLESEILDAVEPAARSCGKLRIEQQFHQHLLDEFTRDLDRALARLVECRSALSRSNCERCLGFGAGPSLDACLMLCSEL
jgi:hypothetical protein